MQLHSLRNEIEKQGLKEILQQLKEFGVVAVEACSRQGLSAKEFCDIIKQSSLEVCAAHVGYWELEADKVEEMTVCEYMNALNCKDIVIPWIGPEMFGENYNEGLKIVNSAIEKFASQGFNISYHNHNHEFEPFDALQRLKADTEKLTFELDIFFVAEKKIDLEKYLPMFDGRIKFFHFKELSKDGAQMPNPFVGEGISKSTVAKEFALKNKMEFAIIEYNDKMCSPYKEYIKEAVRFLA